MLSKLLRRILNTSVIVYFLLAIGAIAYAQQQSAPDQKSCLWKIKSKTNTVYILGSIHLLKKENYPLKEALEKAFDDSKALVFEVNLDDANSVAMQKLVQEKGMFKNGQSLKGSLSKETYELSAAKTKELGIGIEQLSVFKPWLLSLTLTALKLQKLGFDQNQGIDRYFFDKAKKAGKEVLALETFDYQIGLFDTMPGAAQEKFLLQTLKELDVTEKKFGSMLKAWRDGDLKTLALVFDETFERFPDIYEKLLSDRNKNWVPKIEEYLKKNANYVVVVGAGHLVGRENVIDLLKGKGYSPEQL